MALDQTPSDETYDPNTDPTLKQKIEDALESIRPYLNADGGSVRLVSVTPDMVVELELLGGMRLLPNEHHDFTRRHRTNAQACNSSNFPRGSRQRNPYVLEAVRGVRFIGLFTHITQ